MSEDLANAAAAQLATGDDHAAFAAVRAQLGWPAGQAIGTPALIRWVELLGAVATCRGAVALAELAASVVRDPDSPDQLYELGYALIDAGAPEIAATLLGRCLGLVGDSEEVVCELVSALESALAYPDALAVLEAHPALRARSYLARYLYAFNAAMAGQLAITRTVLPTLAPSSPEEEGLHETIAGIVVRADQLLAGSYAASPGAAVLGPADLRGWHYVLTGGLLLHQSPYGYDEPMHGRYAWLKDSAAHVTTAVERVAALAAPLCLPCVYAPSGRDHEILAHAVAARLGVPVAPWPVVGVPAPGLVVVYDLAALTPDEVGQLSQRRAEQLLFAHATPWTTDIPVAPDVTTLLYQFVVPPWEAGLALEAGAAPQTLGEPDTRPAETIGAALAGGVGLDAEELAADEPARLAALVTTTWPPRPGRRPRLWAGGPVSSSRFA